MVILEGQIGIIYLSKTQRLNSRFISFDRRNIVARSIQVKSGAAHAAAKDISSQI